MVQFLLKLFDTADFPARWGCGNWTPGHGWLHIISDSAIFGAYAAIPAVLVYFVLRRKDIPFPPIFWLFAGFILFCGTTHLIEATLFWQPWYRLSGVVKLATAVISWGTVVALAQVVPKALTLPGMARLNEELRKEIQERKQAQSLLETSRQGLEKRVVERTEELECFNRLAIGREQRMIELKREVNELAQALGRPAPYDLSFVDVEAPSKTGRG